ncbi:MAG: electron transfer flavoprotein subunit beta/FixA family protein [Fusobacteriaceae bacterium]|jgi:electron transfer flavoprotein beta subunit|nr:electron transfer flavoprotein subunit beta/FixA family protein [Fusobacteriaceae bacterium]
MEILVCIKQVPDDSVEVRVDKGTGLPAIDGIEKVVNAFDTYALEMAARYVEANGGAVTALSIGPESAKDALRSCLAVGASKAFVVRDDAFEGSDSLGTSCILAAAIGRLEEQNGKPFDLIFCGKETTDSASGQVGCQLAEQLGRGLITNIIALEPKGDGIAAKHETEEGYVLMETAVPAVVTVTKPNYDPRYPTIKSKMAARKMTIEEIKGADLSGLDAAKTGVGGSHVKTVNYYAPPKRQAGVKIKEKTVEEAVAKAIGIMTEAKVI